MKRSLFGLVAFAGVVLIIALIAQNYGLLPNFKDSSDPSFAGNTGDSGSLGDDIQFTPWELQTWLGIKNRVVVVNTDPDFPDPEHRVLQFVSMRNSSSGDYYQKSMEFLCFWEGRGDAGEWEAVMCIYNVPNVTNEFVVEFSRFTWHSLKITLDDITMAEFPQVYNDTVSLGYTSFHVTPL